MSFSRSEIAAASQEQAAGIDQVNKAVVQMDEVTQQNAALVEEAAAASRSLEEQAQELRELVSFFQLDGRQDSATASPKPSRSADTVHTTRSSRQPATGKAVAKRKPAAKAAPAHEDEWDEF